MNEMTDGHTVKRFNEEMRHLHGLVLQIGVLVQQQIGDAVKSLEDEDPEAARTVIHRDQEINRLDIEADDAVVHLIAKRQPMAKDLREILTTSKIVCDLERVGDEARKIARLTVLFYGNEQSPPNGQLLRDIPKMAEYVRSMVERAVRAYDALDLELALAVIHDDIELENEFKAALRRLSTYVMEDARNVGQVTDITLALRALERIGGHAKNIAGHVVFLVRGTDVRHVDLSGVERAIRGGQVDS